MVWDYLGGARGSRARPGRCKGSGARALRRIDGARAPLPSACEVDGRQAGEPGRVLGNPARDLLIGDERRLCGAVQAESSPKSTFASSIASTVTAIAGCSDGTAAPVQRRSEENMSCCRKRSVGCCIQASITTPPFQQTLDWPALSGRCLRLRPQRRRCDAPFRSRTAPLANSACAEAR
jgi:hypothetical protein